MLLFVVSIFKTVTPSRNRFYSLYLLHTYAHNITDAIRDGCRYKEKLAVLKEGRHFIHAKANRGIVDGSAWL